MRFNLHWVSPRSSSVIPRVEPDSPHVVPASDRRTLPLQSFTAATVTTDSSSSMPTVSGSVCRAITQSPLPFVCCAARRASLCALHSCWGLHVTAVGLPHELKRSRLTSKPIVHLTPSHHFPSLPRRGRPGMVRSYKAPPCLRLTDSAVELSPIRWHLLAQLPPPTGFSLSLSHVPAPPLHHTALVVVSQR